MEIFIPNERKNRSRRSFAAKIMCLSLEKGINEGKETTQYNYDKKESYKLKQSSVRDNVEAIMNSVISVSHLILSDWVTTTKRVVRK